MGSCCNEKLGYITMTMSFKQYLTEHLKMLEERYNNLSMAKAAAAEIQKKTGHRVVVVQKGEEKKFKTVPFEIYDRWDKETRKEWSRVG